MTTALQTRFQRIGLQRGGLSGVTLDADSGGVVTVRGVVDSPELLRLATNLVRLEPGVRAIRNELTVRSSAAARK